MRLVGGGGISRVPVDVGVDQRPGAIEILRVGQHVEELRHRVGAGGARQQSIGEAGFRIELIGVGEREHVDRIKDVEMLQLIA